MSTPTIFFHTSFLSTGSSIITAILLMEHQWQGNLGAVVPRPLDVQFPSKKCRTFSIAEWEAKRAHIERMYSTENKTLGSVQKQLADEGFCVTYDLSIYPHYGSFPQGKYTLLELADLDYRRRQLNRKIHDWSLDKSVKSHEMRAIIRMQQSGKKDGERSVFRVRGREVEPAKIKRWQSRHSDTGTSSGPSTAGKALTVSGIQRG
jgi:hypothetical protein